MQILSGKEPAAAIKNSLKDIVTLLKSKHGVTPKLVVIQVSDDPASEVYVRNKQRACDYIGIECDVRHFDSSVTESTLIDEIDKCNFDASVHGVIVQLPLPHHINEHRVTQYIFPEKDVDGFTDENIAKLSLGIHDGLKSCTPLGIMLLLDYYGVSVVGKRCLIIGRSNIVGKPLAMMMTNRDATVTLAHSKTQLLPELCRQADIVVCAIGRANYFDRTYFKKDAVVIDVGINRDVFGQICGDVEFGSVKNNVAAITPVPGGVGLMTVAALMSNVVRATMYLEDIDMEDLE